MIRSAALLLLAVVALTGCGGGDGASAPETAGPAADGVKELANVLQLRADVEADAGKSRLVLLFSPT